MILGWVSNRKFIQSLFTVKVKFYFEDVGQVNQATAHAPAAFILMAAICFVREFGNRTMQYLTGFAN